MTLTSPRLMPLLVTLALLAAPWAARAGSTPVVDLLPANANRAGVQGVLALEAGGPVSLEPPPPQLLEALRWAAPDPNQAACATLEAQVREKLEAQPPAAPDTEDPFRRLIDAAGIEILKLKLNAALETLGQARAWIPCSRTVLAQEQIRRLFLYEALAHLYLEDGQHTQAFLEMLAVDPRLYLEPDYSPRVRQVFVEVAQRLTAIPPLAVDNTAVHGPWFLDGQPIDALRDLRPGRHVLQRRGPDGQLRSALVRVSAQMPVRLEALSDLGVPGSDAAREQLALALSAYRLEPWQQAVLDRALQASATPGLLFAVAPQELGGALLRRYDAGTGLTPAPAAASATAAGPVSARPAPRSGPTASAGGPTTPSTTTAASTAQVASPAHAGSTSAPASTAQVASPAQASTTAAGSTSAPTSTAPAASSTAAPARLEARHSAGPAAARIAPASRLAVALELAVQSVNGLSSTYVANGLAAGYALRLELPMRHLQLEARLAAFPHVLRTEAERGTCGTYTGVGTPTRAQLDDAAACLPARAAFQVAAGVGYPLRPLGSIRLVPALSLEGRSIPQLVLTGAGTDANVVQETAGVGVLARLRATCPLLRRGLEVDVALDLGAGVDLALTGGAPALTVPLSLAAGFSAGF